MTVGELLGRITSQEITDWAAYFEIEREEMEASQKRAKAGQADPVETRQTLGGGASETAADAITRARQQQGLDG